MHLNQNQNEESLHKKVDAKEVEDENFMWSKLASPSKVLDIGKLFRWFMGLGDRLLWNWFEEDVRFQQDYERRQKMKQQKSNASNAHCASDKSDI